MGRPLNKKYFGNRNIGSASTTADNGIGGQAVASIAVTGTFSISVNLVLPVNNFMLHPIKERLADTVAIKLNKQRGIIVL